MTAILYLMWNMILLLPNVKCERIQEGLTNHYAGLTSTRTKIELASKKGCRVTAMLKTFNAR